MLAPGVVALAVLTASLLRGFPSGIAWALVLLAVEYAASLAVADAETVDAAAPLVAAGLLVLAELAYWSLELRGPGREETLVLRRLSALAALAVASIGLGALLVALTAAPLGGGLLWDAGGVAAAAGTIGILAWLASRAARG